MSAIQLAALHTYTLLKYKYAENNLNATQRLLQNANTITPTYFGGAQLDSFAKSDTALMIQAQHNAIMYQAAALLEEQTKAQLSREYERKRDAIAAGLSVFA